MTMARRFYSALAAALPPAGRPVSFRLFALKHLTFAKEYDVTGGSSTFESSLPGPGG